MNAAVGLHVICRGQRNTEMPRERGGSSVVKSNDSDRARRTHESHLVVTIVSFTSSTLYFSVDGTRIPIVARQTSETPPGWSKSES